MQTRSKIVHLAFHQVFQPGEPGCEHPLSCTTLRLGKIVERLQSEGYEIVTCGEYAKLALESDRRLATLSFDDGYVDGVVRALPVLEGLGVPATFFPISCTLSGKLPPNRILTLAIGQAGVVAVSEFISRYLQGSEYCAYIRDDTWCPEGTPFLDDRGLLQRVKTICNTMLPLSDLLDLVGALKREFLLDLDEGKICDKQFLGISDLHRLVEGGMEIGSHTKHHIKLGGRDKRAVLEEINTSIRELTSFLGFIPQSFCLPYGELEVSREMKSVMIETGVTWWNYFERSLYPAHVVSSLGCGFYNRVDHRHFELIEL